jgi:hypothetical protein
MRFHWIAFGVLVSLAARPAPAAIHGEIADAGQVPATAQVPLGSFGTPLDMILGTDGFPGDVDLYKVFILDPAGFSAEVTYFGGTVGDSQLFLFDSGGTLVLSNDDQETSLLSKIEAGSLTGPAGVHYLAFSDYDNDPVVTAGTGLAGWNNDYREPDIGPYEIRLTGVTFAETPEPSSFLVWSSLVAAAVAAWRWRGQTRPPR